MTINDMTVAMVSLAGCLAADSCRAAFGVLDGGDLAGSNTRLIGVARTQAPTSKGGFKSVNVGHEKLHALRDGFRFVCQQPIEHGALYTFRRWFKRSSYAIEPSQSSMETTR